MEDDLIEELIRSARPVSGNRDMRLTERAKRELRALHEDESELGLIRQSVSLRKPLFASLAAMLLIAVAIMALPFVPTQATAATPPLLEIGQDSGAVSSNKLAELALQAKNLSNKGERASSSSIVVEAWALDTEVADSHYSSQVTPQLLTINRTPEGGYLRTVQVLDDIDPQTGDRIPNPATGEVIETIRVDAVDDPFSFEKGAPTSPLQVEAFLNSGCPAEGEMFGWEAINAVVCLLLEQHLDGLQTEALLNYLSTIDRFTFVGRTVDRIGREAVVFLGTSPTVSDYENYLLLSPVDGSILAAETIYVGTNRPYLTPPAVTEYYAWRTI